METIKNKNGQSFKVTVRVNGQKISKCFKRKTDAQVWKQEMLVERRKGSFINLSEDSKMTFEQVYNQWLEQYASTKAPKTFREYHTICNGHFKVRFGSTPLAKINNQDIEQLIVELVKLKRNAKTINKITGVFKQVIKFAIKRRLLRKFPFDEIQILPEPERPHEFFNDTEIQKILAVANKEQAYSVLLIALNTGMRIGEIFGLKWDRIFLNERYFTCFRKMNSTGLEEYTKAKRIRQIGINPELLFEFQRLKRLKPFSEFVISDEHGKPLNPDHYCARVYKKVLKRAGVRSLRFHDLRHTFASHFMMNGGNIFELQQILGHSKIEMTMKYAHLSPEHMVKAASKVGFSSISRGKLIEMSQNCPSEEMANSILS
jgi:integrase